VLIRQNDRAVIWQGSLFEAAFAPDEKHMIVSPNNVANNYDNALTIVEMNSEGTHGSDGRVAGRARAVPSPGVSGRVVEPQTCLGGTSDLPRRNLSLWGRATMLFARLTRPRR
jgi:hypothetical protein